MPAADNLPIRYDFSAARGSSTPLGFDALQPVLASVLEGRLRGINPYGQPGVEACKKNMGRILGL